VRSLRGRISLDIHVRYTAADIDQSNLRRKSVFSIARRCDGWGHPDAQANAINLCKFRGNVTKGSFKALTDRKIRERVRDERQLAEHRTTKHQLQARSSCVADARSYRLARRLPAPAAVQLDWKTLIPMERLKKIRRSCFKKFRDHPFERWLSDK